MRFEKLQSLARPVRVNRFVNESKLILDSAPDLLISWKSFFWTFPVSVIGTVFLNPVPINGLEDFFTWVLITSLGHVAMAPFVIYSKSKTAVGEQLFLLALMGITRGSVMSLLVPITHVTDPMPIYFRILNSLISIGYWFLIGAILIQFMTKFRKDVRELIEESILRDKSIDLPQYNVNSAMLMTRISELRGKIVKTLQAIPSREDLNKSADEIDKLVREEIRPLSHSEWREGELVYVKAGFTRIIFTTLQNRALPLWGIILLTLPYSLIGQIYRFGFIRTFAIQFIWVLLTVSMRNLLLKIVPAKNRDFFLQNIFFIAGIFFIVAPIIFTLQINWPGNTYPAHDIIRLQFLLTISFAVLCSVTAICISVAEDVRSVFRALSEHVIASDPKGFRELSAKSQAEANYAQYLHAKVQSQLLACKLLLLKLADSEFTLFPPEITQQILDRLERIDQPYERVPPRLPSKRVEELAASWKGLATISYIMAPQIDGADAPHDVIGQLIEEAVINAIRHGKAKSVSIKTFAFEKSFAIEVADDGPSDVYFKGSGLGTILFNTFAQNWSIGREGNRTVVKFSILRNVTPA